MKQLSVVIANYNYEKFVAEAIESALGLDWPDVDVVVVDDGSTDGSLDIIRSYGDQIRILATENAGQRVAVNRGFDMSTGDVVIFLDADDVLPANMPKLIGAEWGPSVSKAQTQMQRIDEAGVAIGRPFPAYRRLPTPVDIRRWAATTSAYPTPPASGNAYARWYLERLLPVGEEVGSAADSALLAAAPFLGDVICVPGATVMYRRHGANDSNLLGEPGRFPREVERARTRWCFAQSASKAGPVDLRPLFRSRELLQLRVASQRLRPDVDPIPGDRPARMARDAILSPLRPGPEPWWQRIAIAVWSLTTLVAPQRIAQSLINVRYREAGR